MKIGRLPMFQLGLCAFAAVTGFLASTNNGALLQPTLFAIGGAIVVVLGIVQKFYIDRTTANHAAAVIPEVVRQLGDTHADTTDLPLVARHVVRQIQPQVAYQFLGDQARTLGTVLLSLSLGFAVGFVAGVWTRRTWPLLLTDRFAVAAPWSGTPPSNPLQAAGWIAISERMSQAGVPAEAIRSMYRSADTAPCASDAKKDCETSKAAVAELGRKWLERSGPASSTSAAASTKAAGAANAGANDQAPSLKPIVDPAKGDK